MPVAEGKHGLLLRAAEPTHGGILREDGVDDRDGRPNGKGRVSRLEAQSRAGGILVRYEHPRRAVWRDDGQRLRRGRDFVGARLPAAAERDEGDDRAKASELNALGVQLLPDGSGFHISPVSPVRATALSD